MNIIENSILNFFYRNTLSREACYLVAVSGGSDSMSLLHAMHALRFDVVAAHCNFHLRDDESDGDEAFVRAYCEAQGIPLCVQHFDTQTFARIHGQSIEMAARELRYAWFEEVRQNIQAHAIAVAHHADDSAETVLLNLTRGTGIRGLTGIRPINGHIIRPLLNISHEQILAYLQEQCIDFRTDSSNASMAHTRNVIRHKIIPVLKEINPSFLTTIQNDCQNINEAKRIYEYGLDILKQGVSYMSHDILHINIQLLMQSPAPATLLYEIIRHYGFNQSQADDIIAGAESLSGKKFSCPPYTLTHDRQEWTLSIVKENDSSILIPKEGDCEINGIPYRFNIEEKDADFQISKDPDTACLDADKVSFPLTVRNWNIGDFFYPLGLKGRKKISDFFTDQKFSSEQKKNTKMLISNDNIVWIVGHRLDERVKITEKTQKILWVRPIKS